MANDLTMTSPTYGAGKFGSGLTGGSGLSAAYPSTTSLTLEIWFKTTATSGNQVMFSIDGAYIGLDGSGRVIQGFNGTVSSTTAFNDGIWHHMEVDVQPSSSVFYVDGNVVGSSSAASGIGAGKNLTIGRHQTFGFNWVGSLDEFASWSVVRHTAAFTPPTSAYASGLANMVQLYHFENNGLDSSVAVTAPATMVAPTAAAGNASATVSLTAPSDGGSAITGYTVTSIPAGGVDSNAGSTSLTHIITGLSNGTAYTFTATATNAVGTSPPSPASNSVTPASSGNNALTNGTGNVLFSPSNWNITASTAKAINGGAYFRTVFGGTSCSLQFDTAGLATGFPKLEYRVDGTGPWTTVDLSATVPITMPAETTAYASHLLELNVRATTRTSRWALGGLVALTGIILDAGKAITKPGARPLSGIVFGDSISEALKSLSSSEDTVNSSNGIQSYASILGAALGAEIGVVGFSGQGFGNAGDGGVPVFGSTYNLIYAGGTRTFSPAPDFIVINQGTNDGTNNIVSAATGVLNGLLAATPLATKIFVLRPFNGNQAANLQSAIAACTTPARVFYIDTTGFFTSANSGDGLHPYGWEHITHIGPAVAAAIRPILISAVSPALTARTVTMTLRGESGALAANLTGIQVSVVDDPSRPAGAVIRYQTTTGTTNSAGVLTFTYQSALAAGGTCGVDIVMPVDKRNMAVSVVVA